MNLIYLVLNEQCRFRNNRKTDCFSFAILHYNFRMTKKGFFNAQDLEIHLKKRYMLIAQEGKLCTAKKRREIRSTVY